mmetsp:Transcript_53860/g.128013  ORF Transcript_53860/g.128013 Transcript_53860/m.128013 type:complete len:275 (+) Transcript_53860:3020-3844(+)
MQRPKEPLAPARRSRVAARRSWSKNPSIPASTMGRSWPLSTRRPARRATHALQLERGGGAPRGGGGFASSSLSEMGDASGAAARRVRKRESQWHVDSFSNRPSTSVTRRLSCLPPLNGTPATVESWGIARRKMSSAASANAWKLLSSGIEYERVVRFGPNRYPKRIEWNQEPLVRRRSMRPATPAESTEDGRGTWVARSIQSITASSAKSLPPTSKESKSPLWQMNTSTLRGAHCHCCPGTLDQMGKMAGGVHWWGCVPSIVALLDVAKRVCPA